MNLKKWSESIFKKMKWYDVKLAQWAAIFATLTLITAWPAFLELVLRVEWYWFLALTLIIGIPMAKKLFFD